VELMAGDVTDDPLVPHAGSIALRDVTIKADLLDHWQAPANREQWWRERVARCHAHCAQGPAQQ
jgi:O-succinylbenzoate synthase